MIDILKTLECDVLVAGGGSAGLQAAIGAAEAGASVIIAEKGNTRRSGAGATGNDHFQCYIPEVHGSEKDFLELYMHDRPGGQGRDMDRILAFTRQSFDMVKLWESWGIPMRPHGYWEFTGHNTPDILGTHLKYAGLQQKPIITKQALKRGVQIRNRTVLTEIITGGDGAVCGAVCVNVGGEFPAVQIIRCKALIICTAPVTNERFCSSDRMGNMFNAHSIPNCTGEGTAAAYRAGAVLAGGGAQGGTGYGTIGATSFMNRGGTRTWVGIYTNIYGEPVSDFHTKPDWRYGAYEQYMLGESFHNSYGLGEPMYMNCIDGSDEDIEYAEWALENEGNGATVRHLKDEGFDWRRHMVEFNSGRIGGGNPGGPDVNADGETNIVGLYAAGEVVGNRLPGLSPSVIGGDIAGRSAAAYVKGRDNTDAENADTAKRCIEKYTRLLENPVGTASPDWREANYAIIQTMGAYCGTGVISDSLLTAGLLHIRRIQPKLDKLCAGNSHDFMHCLEVQSLAVCGEIAMEQALYRKETRKGRYGTVKYIGYEEADPDWDEKIVTIQLVNGKPVTGRRDIIK